CARDCSGGVCYAPDVW
nr:immunoglobulin heavy chain junction region [Macaca mulatta]